MIFEKNTPLYPMCLFLRFLAVGDFLLCSAVPEGEFQEIAEIDLRADVGVLV